MENCNNNDTNKNTSNRLGNPHKCDKCDSSDCNYQNFGPNVQQTENDIKMKPNDVDGVGDFLIDCQNKKKESKNDAGTACQLNQVAPIIDENVKDIDLVVTELKNLETTPSTEDGKCTEMSVLLDIAVNDNLSNILKFVDEKISIQNKNTENCNGFDDVEVVNKTTLIEEIGINGLLESNNPISSIKSNETAMETSINSNQTKIEEDNELIDFNILSNSSINHIAPSILEHDEQQFEIIRSTQPNELDEIENDLEVGEYSNSAEKIIDEILQIANNLPPIDDNKQICDSGESENTAEPQKTYKKCVTFYCTDLKNLCENETDDQADTVRTAENSDDSDDETDLKTPP